MQSCAACQAAGPQLPPCRYECVALNSTKAQALRCCLRDCSKMLRVLLGCALLLPATTIWQVLQASCVPFARCCTTASGHPCFLACRARAIAGSRQFRLLGCGICFSLTDALPHTQHCKGQLCRHLAPLTFSKQCTK